MSLNASIWAPPLSPDQVRDDAIDATYQHRALYNSHSLARACRGWDLALCQLEAGPFRGKLMQLVLPQLHLGRFRFNLSLEHLGSSPAGMRTLVIPADPGQRFSWFGQQVEGDGLLVLPTHTVVCAVTPAGHDSFYLSIEESLLDDLLAAAAFRPLRRALAGRDACMLKVPDLGNIRARLHGLHSDLARRRHRDLAPAERLNEPVGDLLAALLAPLAGGSLVAPRSLRRRDRALIEARKLILETDAEDLTVQDLCDAGRASERTLQYAFLEHYGLNPKRYLVVYRLNSVRDDLCRFGSDETKIVEVANRWGFWHMGRFAADYRTLFGELPSETLVAVKREREREPRVSSSANLHQDLAGWVATPLRSWGLQ